MFKKVGIILFIIAVLAVAFWLLSPLFINKKVSEKLEDISQNKSEIISSGSFTGEAGHNALGTVRVIKANGKYYVRLEDDFKVTNGPDLFVYFGKDGQYDPKAQIAPLKGNIGGQNYEVPAEINPMDYNEIWIWCRAFKVPFGKAILQ